MWLTSQPGLKPLVHKHLASCRIGGDDRKYRLTNAVFSIDFNLFPLACSLRRAKALQRFLSNLYYYSPPIDHT